MSSITTIFFVGLAAGEAGGIVTERTISICSPRSSCSVSITIVRQLVWIVLSEEADRFLSEKRGFDQLKISRSASSPSSRPVLAWVSWPEIEWISADLVPARTSTITLAEAAWCARTTSIASNAPNVPRTKSDKMVERGRTQQAQGRTWSYRPTLLSRKRRRVRQGSGRAPPDYSGGDVEQVTRRPSKNSWRRP